MKRTTPLRITFAYRDRILAGARTAELVAPITVGTDGACTWRAPEEDRTMRPDAATLAVKGGRLTIRAAKGAVMHVNGAVVSAAELKAGSRVQVGDCEIRISGDDTARRYTPYHRLEAVGGDRAGEFVQIRKDVFTVGRAKEADLRLQDDTVSACHATLEMRGEDCFLKDDTSRNGTRVNGQRLGGKERLLRDGDILSFGPFDYRYLDRRAPHVRSNAGRSFLLTVLTLILAGAGWYAFYATSPDVSLYLEAARKRAAGTDFDGADAMLEQARKARGFRNSQTTWRRLKDQVAVWRTTSANWESFKSNLSESSWSDAQEQLGTLSLNVPGNWDWDDTTLEPRLREAREAVDLVLLSRNFWLGTRLTDWGDDSRAEIAAQRRRLGVDASGFASDKRAWMQTLKKDVCRRAAIYDANEARYAVLTNELSNFVHHAATLEGLTNAVNAVQNASSGHVRLFAYLVRTPLAKLYDDYRMLAHEGDALAAFDFDSMKDPELRTTPDDCALSTALLEGWQELARERKDLEIASYELREMVARLATYGARLSGDPEPFVIFERKGAVEEALACRLLDLPHPPKPNRTAPADDAYDRLFGYEFLYNYMVEGYLAYPHDVDMAKLTVLNFTPEVRRLYLLSVEIERDLATLAGPEFKWFNAGRLVAFRETLQSWQKRYRAILDHFARIAAGSDDPLDRPAFLARGAWIYLMPFKEVTEEDWADFRKRFVAIRTALRARADALDPAHVEEAYAGADWILKHGIPGSQAVKKAWNFRR